MHITELTEAKLKRIKDRAGVYPVYTDDQGVTHVYLMVPSKEKFGGALPQMGKGGIEKGETPEQAAKREGWEELGLRDSNIESMEVIATDTIRGKKEIYDITVFVAHIKDPDAFDPHGYEAKWSGWVSLKDAMKMSRKNQRHFLKKINK